MVDTVGITPTSPATNATLTAAYTAHDADGDMLTASYQLDPQRCGDIETPIGSEVQVAGLTVSPGSFVWLRAQVSGSSPTTIRIRAWADGGTEPTTWQYSATNSTAGLQVAGGLGLRAYTSSAVTNAPITLSFDDFRATGIGGP